MRRIACVLTLIVLSSTAYAEKDYIPWYRGKYGRNRVFHVSLTVGLGLTYLASETVLKSSLAASSCRWCDPPGFDDSARNAIHWNDYKRANFLSNMDAYVLAPAVGLTLLYFADKDASWGRLIDDMVPVGETVAITELVTQAIKFSVGRQRPFVHYGDPQRPGNNDDNTSFSSGHSALGFAITTSAGMICHWRHYWTEPYVWGSGIAISLSVEYLRMAADKHYLSDVIVGGLLGVAGGLTIPRIMRRDIIIAPVPGGAAVVGQF